MTRYAKIKLNRKIYHYRLVARSIIVSMIGMFFSVLPIIAYMDIQNAKRINSLISPLPVGVTSNTVGSGNTDTGFRAVSLTPAVVALPDDGVPTKESVDAYMKQIFGRDYKLAHAVAMVEGYPKTDKPDWGKSYCWHKVEDGQNKGEYSVGIFQINIIQGCKGEGNKVHWKRIPGETLQEKIDWLSNPYNNIVFARMMQIEHDGFSAWSGYTSGNYLKHLE